ncbi:SIMPL domain-containing protein [Borreliella tanukii]|uniref:SIMPL domain-containing protein n=1 Tax=Borreliella tanukii TaxID=56146 RepID=UPI00264A0B2F|nr:SIMPL domain-containing protein [Borreliella tanukii]WKC79633.1 SIMPL domain-containing protein [Borreliella tanukii]WKC80553.1 SIMPL domain-containing protein [Borreliella tanukii]WKC81467.1 SIMPL domain-containing protein [Borreliella tanukii]
MKILKKNIIELYDQVLLIGNNGGSIYCFDKINDIKSEMLANLIRNAELAALEFARYFGLKLGKIKNANQKYFEFFSVDRSFDNQKLYPKRILMIIATISYYLPFFII